MDIINYISKLCGKNKNAEERTMLSLQPIDGEPEYNVPLSTHQIHFEFTTLKGLFYFRCIQMFSSELNIPSTIIRADLLRITRGMKKNIKVCIEYPYVDEYYRDTYYSFYSRKHNRYNRYCFRLTFFSSDVSENNYYDINSLDEKCYGYCVLRPTCKRSIGYTFFSPLIYRRHDFLTCLCKRVISVKGRLICISAFPFCGQDGEMISCAETSVSMIFDYLSRRYNKYSRLLPSQISSMISDSIIDRKQPSKGVDIETISAIMNANGINTRQYSKVDQDSVSLGKNEYQSDDFYRLLHIYIESGFPLYVITKKHALIVCGRQNKLFVNHPKLLVMDDNKKPYSYLENESDITGFVVPMSENILLEANDIVSRDIIAKVSRDYPLANFTDNSTEYYHRVFLTTSRSLKSHFVNSQISPELRNSIVCIAMPKFVWVCESFKIEHSTRAIHDIPIVSLLVLDTTEYSENYNHLLFAKTQTAILIPADDKTHMQRKQYFFYRYNDEIHPFVNNLKGEHNNWNL